MTSSRDPADDFGSEAGDPPRLKLASIASLQPRGTVVLLLSSRFDRSGSAARALELSEAWARAGRRIVLADLHLDEPLLGDAPEGEPLEGLVDVFLYGASLSRIARPAANGSFYLIPAGTYAPDPEEIYQHPRWRKVIAGFQDTGATLLLFVAADSPTLPRLSALATEAILLDDQEWARTARSLAPSGIELIGVFEGEEGRGDRAAVPLVEDDAVPDAEVPPAAVATPDPEDSLAGFTPDAEGGQGERAPGPVAPERATPAVADSPAGVPPVDAEADLPAPHTASPTGLDELELPPPPARSGGRKRRSLFMLGLLLIVLVLTTVYLLAALRPDFLPGGEEQGSGVSRSGAAMVTASPIGPLLNYSVQVRAFTSLSAARSHLVAEQRRVSGVPLFISPEEIQGVLYYRVMAGMMADTAAAIRLRSRLVENGVVEEEEAISTYGLLQYAPLAIDVGEFPSREQAMARSDSLLALDIPTYVAVMPYSDGTRRWRLYGGAYRDSSGAEGMLALLRDAGVQAQLTVRAGDPAPAFE